MKYIIAFALLFLSSCASVQTDVPDTLKYYETRNPHEDVAEAIKNNDLRFIAMMGEGLSVPGIANYYSDYKSYGYLLIKDTSDNIYNYEYGRLMLIAEHYAHEYNIKLLKKISEIKSWEMAKSIEGWVEINNAFNIDRIMKGDINMLPYSLHPDLSSKTPACVNNIWWFNPIENEIPKYNWNDLQRVYKEVNHVTCQHIWVNSWVNSGANRVIEAQIFGVRPYTETSIEFFVQSAWKIADLASKPYYELNMRENNNWVGTFFISEDGNNALITSSIYTDGLHWLDKQEFSYHPKDNPKTFILTNQLGEWKRINEAF